SLTSLPYPLFLTTRGTYIANIVTESPPQHASHRHFYLPRRGVFARVRPSCRRGARTCAMLPPFEAILFDYDGTLAVLNLDFAAMRQQLLAFTVAQGIAHQELHGFDILEMLAWATACLHQRHPEQAVRYAREAE